MGDEGDSIAKAQPQRLVTFTGRPGGQTAQPPEKQKTNPLEETKKDGNLNSEKPKSLPGIKHSVEYQFAGDSLLKRIRKGFPKQMIPTKITGYLLFGFFLLSLLPSLFTFPMGKMLAGDVDFAIEVGYPWPFFVMEILNPQKQPLVVSGFVYDLLLFLLVAYALEIAFNYFITAPFMKSSKERSIMPKWIRNIGEKRRRNYEEKEAKKMEGNEPYTRSQEKSTEEKAAGQHTINEQESPVRSGTVLGQPEEQKTIENKRPGIGYTSEV